LIVPEIYDPARKNVIRIVVEVTVCRLSGLRCSG
jgi:hypothetical protein